MINFQIQRALIFFIIGGCLGQIQATVNCPNDSFPSSSANTACQAFHPSGSLASVSNAFDNQNLISKLQDIFGITNQSVWLGGNDATVPGKWEWIDGTSMQYTNWAPGSPSNDPISHYLLMNISNGQWYTQNCYLKNYYVCEFVPVTCHVTCPDGWAYYSKTNYCYKNFVYKDKFHLTNGISFDVAEEQCNQNNGHLASIHSGEESAFLTNIGDAFYYIGLKYINGTFEWVDGTSLDYSLWDTDQLQPNTTLNRYCTITDGSYLTNPFRRPWRTTVCSGSYDHGDVTFAIASFVCQQRPQSSSKEFEIKQYERNHNALQTSICSATCPDGWTYFAKTNFCYKHFEGGFVLSAAKDYCIRNGGQIVSVHSQEENNFIEELLPLSDRPWLGLVYDPNTSSFSWIDNTPFDFQAWGNNEPDVTNNQYCVKFWINMDYSYSWTTAKCSDIGDSALGAICKKAP